MAGITLLGDVLTFDLVAITHLTAWTLNVQGGQITQVVADQAAALTKSQPVVKSVNFSFAVPAAAAATLLTALAEGAAGPLTLVIKDGVGGSTIATWTASGGDAESQGVSVSASGGAFTLGSCTLNTNGGSWA